jgi:hypothetical protein
LAALLVARPAWRQNGGALYAIDRLPGFLEADARGAEPKYGISLQGKRERRTIGWWFAVGKRVVCGRKEGGSR